VITDPHSVVNCSYEAPNAQSLLAIFSVFTVAQHCVAKFVYSTPNKYTKVLAPWFNQINTFIWGGLSQHGEVLGNLCADLNGMGGGARADADGEPGLSPIFATMADTGEQEFNEEEVPFLQLVSKKITRDTQAPGKYRGGQGYQMIVATKDSDQWGFMTVTTGAKIPPIQGLFGGYACGTYPLCKVSGVDVYDEMKSNPKAFKHSIEEIMNDRPFSQGKYSSHHMGMGFELSKRGELFMISQGSGAGYGDLLERDPHAVIRDIEAGLLSAPVAAKLYKIVFNEKTLILDMEATKQARKAEREARLKRGVPFKDFIKTWNKPKPPKDIPYFGSWGPDNSVLYVGSADRTRPADKPMPNYMRNPKDVRIEQLEARIAELTSGK
jgi:N-methylhydantoinase B/oxoprolinase/acetone carboxylase alpha subunit